MSLCMLINDIIQDLYEQPVYEMIYHEDIRIDSNIKNPLETIDFFNSKTNDLPEKVFKKGYKLILKDTILIICKHNWEEKAQIDKNLLSKELTYKIKLGKIIRTLNELGKKDNISLMLEGRLLLEYELGITELSFEELLNKFEKDLDKLNPSAWDDLKITTNGSNYKINALIKEQPINNIINDNSEDEGKPFYEDINKNPNIRIDPGIKKPAEIIDFFNSKTNHFLQKAYEKGYRLIPRENSLSICNSHAWIEEAQLKKGISTNEIIYKTKIKEKLGTSNEIGKKDNTSLTLEGPLLLEHKLGITDLSFEQLLGKFQKDLDKLNPPAWDNVKIITNGRKYSINATKKDINVKENLKI